MMRVGGKKFQELMLCLFAAIAALTPVYLQRQSDLGRQMGQIDFYPTFIGGKLYLENKKDAIYGNVPYGRIRHPDWIKHEMQLPDGHSDTVFPYTPAYLLAFVPLVKLMDYPSLINAFLAMNFMLFAFLAARVAAGLSAPFPVRILVACLICQSFIGITIMELGQNFLLCGLFLWLHVGSVIKKKAFQAALFLALAAACKPWAVLFGIVPFFRRNMRMTFIVGLGLLVFFAAQALFEPQLTLGYFLLTLKHSSISILATNNVSLSAAIHRLLMDHWFVWATWQHAGAAPLAAYAIKAALAAMVLAIGWRDRRPSVQALGILTAIFLVMNVFWDYYLALFLPFTASALFPWNRRKLPLAALAVMTLFFSQAQAYPFLYWLVYRHFPAHVETLIAGQTLLPALLALSVFLTRATAGVRRRRRSI